MSAATEVRVDDVGLFEAMASDMNAHPERFTVLGDCDMAGTLVMQRDDGTAFAVEIVFEELGCAGVHTVDGADVDRSDFKLVGPLVAWEAMFADIRANGCAVGRQTINSLALLGTDIALRGADPMGVDKFSRFNQTLQEYLDGASRVVATDGGRP